MGVSAAQCFGSFALVWMTACGGRVADATAADAGAPFPFDAAVSCGAAECAPGAVCVTTYTGLGALQAPDDAGRCPEGTVDLGGQECMPVNYQCRMMPSKCTPSANCNCIEACGGQGFCTCGWPPISQQFPCDCSAP